MRRQLWRIAEISHNVACNTVLKKGTISSGNETKLVQCLMGKEEYILKTVCALIIWCATNLDPEKYGLALYSSSGLQVHKC